MKQTMYRRRISLNITSHDKEKLMEREREVYKLLDKIRDQQEEETKDKYVWIHHTTDSLEQYGKEIKFDSEVVFNPQTGDLSSDDALRIILQNRLLVGGE